MFNKEANIDEYMVSAETLFYNVTEVEISNELDKWGYNAVKIDEGRALFNTAKTANEKQKKEYAEKYSSVEQFYKEKEEFKNEYSKHVKICRVIFEDNIQALNKLGVLQKRERSYGKWIVQAENFYKAISEDEGIKTELSGYGITAEKLIAIETELAEVKKAHYEKNKETGEAQAATKERDAKLDELDKWLSGFVKVARIALEDNPQLLEMLGIKVAS